MLLPMNDFTTLSTESEISSLAQVSPEELAEYNAWLDERDAETADIYSDVQ